MAMTTMNGVVKTLHAEKGFGFIRADNGNEYFFHCTAVKNARLDALSEGQGVTFREGMSPKGPRAEDVYANDSDQ
jgi:CspA family cold shock protein